MVEAGDRSPVFKTTKRRLPSLISRTWPLEPAIARTVTAIEKRSRAVAHPPFLRGIMAVRGVLDNPLTDRLMATSVPPMEEAFAAEAERIGAAATARGVGGR